MTTRDMLDEICSISISADKAKTVIDYIFNQYFSSDSESIEQDQDKILQMELSYDTIRTFLLIAFDYLHEVCEVSNRLCQLQVHDIKYSDEMKS